MGKAKKYPHQKVPKHGQNLPTCLFSTFHGGSKVKVSTVNLWKEFEGSFFSEGIVTALFDVQREAKMLYRSIKRALQDGGAEPEMWHEPSFGLISITAMENRMVFRTSLNFKINPAKTALFEEIVEAILWNNHYDRKGESNG
jgi:hypothetical protein